MSAEQNKAVVRRLLEGLNTRNWNVISALVDEVFAADFVVHADAQPGAAIGREGVKTHMRDVLEKSPDRHYTVDDLIAEGDKVVLRATCRGTDAKTGRPVGSHAITIYRFAAAEIGELWQISIDVEA